MANVIHVIVLLLALAPAEARRTKQRSGQQVEVKNSKPEVQNHPAAKASLQEKGEASLSDERALLKARDDQEHEEASLQEHEEARDEHRGGVQKGYKYDYKDAMKAQQKMMKNYMPKSMTKNMKKNMKGYSKMMKFKSD